MILALGRIRGALRELGQEHRQLYGLNLTSTGDVCEHGRTGVNRCQLCTV